METLARHVDLALDAACALVQAEMGVMTGDAAGVFWASDEGDALQEAVRRAVEAPVGEALPPGLPASLGLRARERFVAVLGEEADLPGATLARVRVNVGDMFDRYVETERLYAPGDAR